MVVEELVMTEKQESAFEKFGLEITKMSNKLFGNGTRNGCMDQRLENVEELLKNIKDDILPTIVTRDECNKRHEVQWSHRILVIGLVATWLTLILRSIGVI